MRTADNGIPYRIADTHLWLQSIGLRPFPLQGKGSPAEDGTATVSNGLDATEYGQKSINRYHKCVYGEAVRIPVIGDMHVPDVFPNRALFREKPKCF